METIATPQMWGIFFVFVVIATVIDLKALSTKGASRVSVREALGWTALWIALSMAFAGWLWWHLLGTSGPEVAREKTFEFLTGI